MHIPAITELIKSNTIFDEFFQNKKVIFFNGEEYPILFFSLLNQTIKSKYKNFSYLNFNDLELHEIIAQLELSFLGDSFFYWLGNISDENEKKLLNFFEYINQYDGPNKVIFFINDEYLKNINSSNCEIYKIEEINNNNQLKIILNFFYQEKNEKLSQFIQKILLKYKKLSLDELCVLIHYGILLGNKNKEFIDNWLEKILKPEFSLFQLSKYFFAKDSKSFFKYWNLIEQDYAQVFWTTYWSEQLFRAYNFIYLQKNSHFVQAKQIAYKLPFSFIQNDWKKHNENKLKNAHKHIYKIDYFLKNGASEFSLDLFYAKYFNI